MNQNRHPQDTETSLARLLLEGAGIVLDGLLGALELLLEVLSGLLEVLSIF